MLDTDDSTYFSESLSLRKQKPAKSFAVCMEFMCHPDPEKKQHGFHALRQNVATFLPLILHALERETNHGIQCWLLELVVIGKEPSTIPLLASYLYHKDDSLRYWAKTGLKDFGTRQALRIIRDAEASGFESEPPSLEG